LAAAAQAQNRPQEVEPQGHNQNHNQNQNHQGQHQQAINMFGDIDLSIVDPSFLEGLNQNGMDLGFPDAEFSFNEFLYDGAMGDGDGDGVGE
jgi:hypothetical protein